MKADRDRPRNRRATLRAVAALAAGAAFVVAAFALGTASRASSASAQQPVTIEIRPSVHRHEVVLSPNVAIMPGARARIEIVNTSREVHTFTIPKLGVNTIVLPGSPDRPRVTEVTFTARAFGVFRWHCEFCPRVHHEGPMGGEVYAIVGA